MTGKDLYRLSIDIVKLVNLVAFDALGEESCQVHDTVNPLVKRITANKVDQIPKEHKSQLRKLIKRVCKRHGVYAGEIRLDHDFSVKIYLTRRVKPAWLSSIGQDSEEA